jgi:predicted RNase H-like nuclease (RuvC/YqgF family)
MAKKSLMDDPEEIAVEELPKEEVNVDVIHVEGGKMVKLETELDAERKKNASLLRQLDTLQKKNIDVNANIAELRQSLTKCRELEEEKKMLEKKMIALEIELTEKPDFAITVDLKLAFIKWIQTLNPKDFPGIGQVIEQVTKYHSPSRINTVLDLLAIYLPMYLKTK